MSNNFIKHNIEIFFNESCKSIYLMTFIKFLHIKKLYAKFMYNLIFCHKNSSEVSKLNIFGPNGYIFCSFPWWKTIEGDDFWHKIHCEWNEWLHEMSTIKINKPDNKWYEWLKEKD